MLALGFASFVCFGAVLVLVGANQAELASELGLDLARSGLLVSAVAVGVGTGVVGGGALLDRSASKPLFVAAAGIAAAALLSVTPGTGFERALVHVGLAGLGIGAYSMVINVSVVERFRERSARPMAAVHSAATLGAVLGAPLIGWITGLGHWTGSFRWVGAAHLAVALAALPVAFPERAVQPASGSAPGIAGLWAALLPFALAAFAYIGVESTMTLFAVPYATAVLELPPDRGRTAISAFWLGLFLGRLGVVALRGPLDERVLLFAGGLGAAVLGLGVAASAIGIELLFAGAGAALGCVYPVLIARTGQRFPQARGTASGIVAGCGALGGFAVPWLSGAVGDGLGVTAALQSLALWCVVISLSAGAALRAAPAHGEVDPLRSA